MHHTNIAAAVASASSSSRVNVCVCVHDEPKKNNEEKKHSSKTLDEKDKRTHLTCYYLF